MTLPFSMEPFLEPRSLAWQTFHTGFQLHMNSGYPRGQVHAIHRFLCSPNLKFGPLIATLSFKPSLLLISKRAGSDWDLCGWELCSSNTVRFASAPKIPVDDVPPESLKIELPLPLLTRSISFVPIDPFARSIFFIQSISLLPLDPFYMLGWAGPKVRFHLSFLLQPVGCGNKKHLAVLFLLIGYSSPIPLLSLLLFAPNPYQNSDSRKQGAAADQQRTSSGMLRIHQLPWNGKRGERINKLYIHRLGGFLGAPLGSFGSL